jgi:hypothetical protein
MLKGGRTLVEGKKGMDVEGRKDVEGRERKGRKEGRTVKER